jgi:hypothetical protein
MEINANNLEKKYLGNIKWYDSEKGFGLIQDFFNNNEYFVHRNNTYSHIAETFSREYSEKLYIFNIKDSHIKKDRIEAFKIEVLSQFNNYEVLYPLFFSILKNKKDNSKIFNLHKYLSDIQKKSLFSRYFKELIEIDKIDVISKTEKFQQILPSFDMIDFIYVESALINQFLEDFAIVFSENDYFNLWKFGLIDAFDVNYISFFSNLSKHEKFRVFVRVSQTVDDNKILFDLIDGKTLILEDVYLLMGQSQLFDYLFELISKYIIIDNYTIYIYFEYFANVLDLNLRNNTINLIIDKASENLKYELWLKSKYDNIDINIIKSLKFKSLDEQNRCFKRVLKTFHDENEIFELIFKDIFQFSCVNNLLNEDQIIKYFLFFLSKYSIIEEITDFDKIFTIYDRIKIPQQNIYFDQLFEKIAVIFKIKLWLENKTETINYQDVLDNIANFNDSTQKILFQKLFADIELNKFQVKLEKFNQAFNIDNFNQEKIINASIYITIKIIEILKNETNLEDIYLSIVNYLNKFRKLDSFIDLFVKCTGLIIISDSQTNNSQYYTNETLKNIKGINKVKLKILCEGRKAKNNNNEIILDSKHQKEFNWCQNKMCFKSAFENCINLEIVQYHQFDDYENSKELMYYEKYNLIDFCRILHLNFENYFHARLNGYLNRLNSIFSKIKCKSCNELLLPAHENNYGFYRVSLFRCNNVNCVEYIDLNKNHKKGDDKIIYLSHCNNSKCQNIIDSRESKRCLNGWYICDYCLACCSENSLNYRNENLILLEQNRIFTTLGHKDKGEIYCCKCGGLIIKSNTDDENYKKTFKWFKKNQNNNSIIRKYGINKNNKYWWLLLKNEWSLVEYQNKLKNLIKLGFEIPDIDDEFKTMYLISGKEEPPNIKILKCNLCGFELNLESETDKKNAIEKYHTEFFS